MKALSDWLQAYDACHRHPLNRRIHKVAVPAIMFAILGALWLVELPSLNVAVPIAVLYGLAAVLLDRRLGVLLVWELLALLGLAWACERWLGARALWLHASIFVVAWAAQFYGHHVEKMRPAFLQDLLFLLVGPLWTLRSNHSTRT